MAQGQARWNAEQFAQQLAQARLARDYHSVKKLLKEVAESNYKFRSEFQVPRTVPVTYVECQQGRLKAGKDPTVSFSKLSTADALMRFAQDRRRVVCGLNFANGKDVGGGYKNGATAQEEDLCRQIPALYTSLYRADQDGLYPFGPSTCASPERPEKYADVLYTSGLVIGRASEVEGFAFLPERQRARVSLVAAAAPNIKFGSDISDPDLLYKAITSIFLAPKIVEPEVTTLILGAWGCGAFGGDPVVIAQLFMQALVQDNLGQHYRDVHFAIPQTSPQDVNYDTFRAVFERSGLKIMDV